MAMGVMTNHQQISACQSAFSLAIRHAIIPAWRASLLVLSLGLATSVANAAEALSIDADEFLDTYCSRCHNDERMSGNWTLSTVHSGDIAQGHSMSEWENILRVTARGEMPPAHKPQPNRQELTEFLGWVESSLDSYAAQNPNPGRATLRRLNRTEYSNAVRDLLHLDVNIRDSLPADDTGYGFDNIADVLSVSPTLMDRYIAVAGKVSRLAVGVGSDQPFTTTHLLPKDGSILNQGVPSYDERMSTDLPLNSRGGGAFTFYAPRTGTYQISGYLNSNTNNEVDRLTENQISLRVPLTAGSHSIGITFRKELALDESVQTLHNSTDVVPLPTAPPTTLNVDFIVDGGRVGSTQVPSYYMSPRFAQKNFPRDVLQIDVEGPYQTSDVIDTPSTAKIFICRPNFLPFSANRCAKKIISNLAQQAYRRPANSDDIEPLLGVYTASAQDNNFEEGIAAAIQALLVSPNFLFLYEQDSPDAEPGSVHPISDTEFAARMALFLWSSLPDAELLDLAVQQKLRDPHVLQQQLARMLADDRAAALEENFAGQWLYLRNLESHRPDVVEFPDFDIPLRHAMQRESELFFASIVDNNLSILEFINSDFTFLNERLANHYGIDDVNGPMFRKVTFDSQAKRGGLLGQGSILTVTSYGNHTSVVRRGKWILDNLLAAPPPPPPPDIPALKTKSAGKQLNAREQLALHSEDPACASCHVKMDPLGLALENYDAVGNFRTLDAGRHIDASAIMPNGQAFEGLPGLQQVLLDRKQQFASAFTQRLMTYALGRGLEPFDQPKVRNIVRAAEQNQYRIHTIILGILQSEPFNYRRTPSDETTTLTQSPNRTPRPGRCDNTASDGVITANCLRGGNS